MPNVPVLKSVINGRSYEVDPQMIKMIKQRLQQRLLQVRSTRVPITSDLVESELLKLVPAVGQKPWFKDFVIDFCNRK